MFFSIIIPCYNVDREQFFQCISSVISQQYKNFEIIIIDDGSASSYATVYDDIEKLDSRIRVYRQINKGVSAARNVGVDLAVGDYIVFVDADDVVSNLFLKEAVSVIKSTEADFVIGGNAIINNSDLIEEDDDKQNALMYEVLEHKNDFKVNIIGDVKHFTHGRGYFGRGPWTRCVKRDLAKRIPFNEKLRMGEDIIWNLDVLDNSLKTVLVYEVWYYYRINPKSVNHKYNPKLLNDIELELPELFCRINIDDAHMLSAYGIHVLDEIEKIYYCFLGNKQNTMKNKEQKIIKQYIYSDSLWSNAGIIWHDKVGIKNRIRSFLFYEKCFFAFLLMKRIIKLLFV